MQRISADWVKETLPKRTTDSHKFKNGYLMALVGSKNYPGAARLATHAAARVGAGGVQLLTPESLWPLVAALPPEIMPVILKEHNGELTHVAAFEAFLAASERSKALLIGCGLGRSPDVREFISAILSHTDLPVVVDGDGLYALGKEGKEFILRHAQGRWILTPHQGELERLLTHCGYIGSQSFEQMAERTRIFCQEMNVVVVAKSFPTIIYMPAGDIFVNPTGNPAASTAGCGDVLAGIIAGLLAQGLTVDDAAKVGMYMAGHAADEIIKRTGSHSLMASDLIHELP